MIFFNFFSWLQIRETSSSIRRRSRSSIGSRRSRRRLRRRSRRRARRRSGGRLRRSRREWRKRGGLQQKEQQTDTSKDKESGRPQDININSIT